MRGKNQKKPFETDVRFKWLIVFVKLFVFFVCFFTCIGNRTEYDNNYKALTRRTEKPR